jgi:hypothetical protein
MAVLGLVTALAGLLDRRTPRWSRRALCARHETEGHHCDVGGDMAVLGLATALAGLLDRRRRDQ